MQFDDLLKQIGEFGPYQKRLYALMCLPALNIASLLVANIFILGVPEHRCKIPDYNGTDTWEIQDEYHRQIINKTIPDSDEHPYDRCHLYETGSHVVGDENNRPINASLTECSEWVYDSSVYRNTFSQQMNYMCDDTIWISHAQMIFFLGVLSGSFGFGQLSDLIGRKKTLYVCLVTLLASGVGIAWSPNFVVFVILMFIMGASNLGTYMTIYVMGMELVGPSKRVWTGNIIALFLTTGQLYLLLMAFLLRHWHDLQLAVSLPCCLYLAYWWLLPESSRWLLSKGRTEEAKVILSKVAHSNKTELPEKAFEDLEGVSHRGRIWQLFTRRRLAIMTLVIFFNWFVVSMTYYGVLMNIGNLGGDLYLNFLLITLVEYPSKVLTMTLMDRWGRKKLYIAYMLTGGLACIGTVFPILYKDGHNNLHALLIALTMVGKMGIVGGFEVIYVLSAEIFPTVVRNSGMGASSAWARVGSMIAPYIAKSADLVGGLTGKAIPLTLFGVLALLAGLLCTLLPETVNRRLPDTIDQANNVGRTTVNEEKYKFPEATKSIDESDQVNIDSTEKERAARNGFETERL